MRAGNSGGRWETLEVVRGLASDRDCRTRGWGRGRVGGGTHESGRPCGRTGGAGEDGSRTGHDRFRGGKVNGEE